MAELALKSLGQRIITFEELCREIKPKDKRNPEAILQRYVSCNQSSFHFLGITARVEERDYKLVIVLTTGRYVGAAPLFSPLTGKPYKNVVVRSRFNEDVAELANLLQEMISPEFCELELRSGDNMHAPIYLECMNFFTAFTRAMNVPWNKFDTIRKREAMPSSSTNWTEYATHSWDPYNAFVFKNRKSIQSTDHREWHQLSYMARVALKLFLTPLTPYGLKIKVKRLTDTISRYVSNHECERVEHQFQIRSLDPMAIKELKEAANVLMQRSMKNKLAWRIDSAELFERYTQYVLGCAASKIGGRCLSNRTFSISGQRPSWCLRYLEPDIILQTADMIIAIDAKYKSHLFNTQTDTEDLRDTFRHDLHQLLAYSSFDSSLEKKAALIYPHSEYKEMSLRIGGGLARASVEVLLIGIPLDTTKTQDTVKRIADILK